MNSRSNPCKLAPTQLISSHTHTNVRREPKGQTFPAVQLPPGMPAIADASSILAPLKDTITKVLSSQKIQEDKLKHVLELAVMFRNNCLLCWY
jgi:hypothetical protein